MISKLKGTRDFYPDDWFKVNYIRDNCSFNSVKYGFEEYEAPIIESLSTFEKKSGGEIPEQLYCFKDKNDDSVVLRPEMTPILARMIAQRHKELKKPIKYFCFSRFFRYEKPQLGRGREFFQFNADILGKIDVYSMSETLMLLIDILKSLKLDESSFRVRVNSRVIMDAIFDKFNVSDKDALLKLIDKREKLEERVFLEELKVLVKDFEGFNKLFSMPLSNLPIDEVFKKDLVKVFSLLESLGYMKYVKFDLSIVRGLNYYTGIVFEAFDLKHNLRAIAGGGAYSNLIKSFDESCDLEGIGFGLGDMVLTELLEKSNLMPKYTRHIDYYVCYLGDLEDLSFKVSTTLREYNMVYFSSANKGLSKHIEDASLMNAKRMVIIGEKDLKNNQITIKDLETGEEIKQSLDDFLSL